MATTPPETQSTAIATELAEVRAMIARREFDHALATSQALSARVPGHRDAGYMVAACLRYLRRIPEALDTLDVLERQHPNFSGVHQERGHCYFTLKDAPRAIASYRVAVQRNPALVASWRQLAALYGMVGDAENARIAMAHVEATARIAPEVLTATALHADGDLHEAENLVRAYLLRKGDDVEAMRLLAKIALDLDVLDDAELLLGTITEIAPDYTAARYDYARTLLRRHKYAPALAELDRLVSEEPDNRTYRTTRATAHVGLGHHELALALYRGLLEGATQPADLHLSIAHSLKTLGRTEEAIAAYRDAAAARAHFGDAYWSLANLKTYRFSDAELAAMAASEADAGVTLPDRYHLCFALGKALEDRGEHARSFDYYARGNALRRTESRFDIAEIEANTTAQKSVCTREFFATRAGWGAPEPDPIFIVGLPRSGSTLLEQILASHSMVEGTMELADIATAVVELEGRGTDARRYPGVLAALGAEDFRRIGEKYLTDTRAYRTDRPYFIDKMPNNFRHVGLIHLMLPNAKIIDARREPMACCCSNFKQLFASGQEFTYSLEDIARYYRTYVELMAHWDAVLPGRVLRIQHEDVVDDLEGNVRRILEYCGLPFEQACLEFHKTERSVRTASSEQVRRPIFREGLDQWKHFEPWLGPLKAALGDAATR